jgi:hypothetical protein
MPSPTGSVPALSAAAATIFSIGIVFLGYWGVHEPTQWHFSDVLIVGFALTGFACLGLVPWLATSPADSDTGDGRIPLARHLFIVGVAAIWLSVALSVVA